MRKAEKAAFIIIALLSTAYVLARLIINPLVNDEAYTFIYFIFSERFIPFFEDTLVSANNHYLNSLLGWLFYKVLGIDPFVLRLPNFLAYLAFLFYNYRIGKDLFNTHLRIGFWLFTLATPILLEFFTYARGYGLSLGLLSGAIYHLSKSLHNDNIEKDWKSITLLVLAVSANLNLIYCLPAWLLFYFIHCYGKMSRNLLLINFSVRIMPFLVLGWTAWQLKKQNALYFGTNEGLLASLASLLQMMLGYGNKVLAALVLLMLVVVIFWLLYIGFRDTRFSFAQIMTLFLAASLFGTWLQALLLGGLMPIQRALIHWYYLIIITLFTFFAQFSHRPKPVVAIALILPFWLILLSEYNVEKSSLGQWSSQQVSEKLYDAAVIEQQKAEKRLSIASNYSFIAFTWKYLNLKNMFLLNDLQILKNLNIGHPDLLVIPTSDSSMAPNSYKKIYSDQYHCLLSRKKRVNWNKLSTLQKSPGQDGFYELEIGKFKLDSGRYKIEGLVKAKAKLPPAPFYLQWSYKTLNDGKSTTRNTEISCLKKYWQEDRVIHFSKELTAAGVPGGEVSIKLQNPWMRSVKVSFAECSIFKI